MDRREVNRWIEEQRHYFKPREEGIEISVEELLDVLQILNHPVLSFYPKASSLKNSLMWQLCDKKNLLKLGLSYPVKVPEHLQQEV